MCGLKKFLNETHPLLCKERNYEKNGDLFPCNVTYGSHKKVYWKCKRGHEWKATIKNRTVNNTSCPYCSGNKVSELNSLEKNLPNLLIDWDYEKNAIQYLYQNGILQKMEILLHTMLQSIRVKNIGLLSMEKKFLLHQRIDLKLIKIKNN